MSPWPGSGHSRNTDCRREYLAREAQQQAAQREERQGKEAAENGLLHGGKYIMARGGRLALPPKQSFSPSRYVPFFCAGRHVGWLRPELAARLGAWPAVFRVETHQIQLLEPDSLNPIVEQLAREGFIPGWRNERYGISGLFEIERAAARPFGLTTYAVHVNGISFDEKNMWIARRSAAKPIDPGMLDNLVGGGLTAGLSLEEVLVKEAWEEAGISADLARSAKRGGTVRILREVPEGVQSEVISVYDLVLPAGFEPRNQDAEVAEFHCLPFDEVLRLLRETEQFTLDATLVAMDYFTRNAPRGSAPAGAGRAT
jgi:8-oxo-dGTP pyrophosphatase MutT (NUDIX family)